MTDIVIFIKIFKKIFSTEKRNAYIDITNQKAKEKWDEFATKNDA
jgi:hypothetical protein